MARKRLESATDQRGFFMVYTDSLESDLLEDHYEKLLFIYLKKFADNNTGKCFPSIKTLAQQTKISSTKVKQTLTVGLYAFIATLSSANE